LFSAGGSGVTVQVVEQITKAFVLATEIEPLLAIVVNAFCKAAFGIREFALATPGPKVGVYGY
jgi:hypothetical protein